MSFSINRKRLGKTGDWRIRTRSRLEGRLQGLSMSEKNPFGRKHGSLAHAKLPLVRFHDLRHSAASLLIAEGVDLVEVSMLLGHSELRVTADLYSHFQKQTVAKAARRMDAVLG
jgi:integrase